MKPLTVVAAMRYLCSSCELKSPLSGYIAPQKSSDQRPMSTPRSGGPYSGRNGLTANWMTRYGAATRARVSHWLTKIRSSSSVDPGEM